MPQGDASGPAAEAPLRRLCYFNAGFFWQGQVRRMLRLAGYELRAARTGGADAVVVWGRSPHARRGEAVATARGLPLLRVEDAFLRSVRPGRSGDAPLGLLIDTRGVHFDSSVPSDLEQCLATHDLDNSNLLQRARAGIDRIRALHLSKYNIHDPDLPPPTAGYVLVVDQTRGDSSIRHGAASEATFAEMLAAARLDYPQARIVIRSHPETSLGHRAGHFGPADCDPQTVVCGDPVSPQALLEGAIAVYTVSSQLGFEAILAGHRPQVFGQPWYAGWGLTADRQPIPRRKRRLTAVQLFAAAMILQPIWYDPCRDRLCSFEEALDQLEAEVRAYREDRHGYVATGMRLWKRRHLQAFFGRERPLLFRNLPDRTQAIARKKPRPVLVWGTGPAPDGARRIEDGFLRSRGLGAALVPPLSLVSDDLGLYYDPHHESRLERLILSPLPPGGADRAERLRAQLIAAGVSKYNLGGTLPNLPAGHRILVPGQVENDASIRLGAGEICTNLGLLRAVRAANPDAVIVYKPHPDVEAGLRPGAVQAEGLANVIARSADPIRLIEACDEVWTMTSLLGFEALLRDKPVTCTGAPFYAGWGLTRDLGAPPERRRRAPDGHALPRPGILHLIHAALIAYPRYYDPVSRRPCPVEVAVDRLAQGQIPHPGAGLRLLSKLQGLLASQAHLWRQ